MKQTYTLLLLLFTLLTACSESENPSPVLRGSVSGKVNVFNEYNEPEPAKGVTVQALVGNTTLEASIDENGNYTITNVPYGQWTYLISKPGFKQHYKKDFNLSEEKATLDFSMSRAPTFYVDRAEFYVHNDEQIRANVLLSEAVPAGKEFTLVTYVGKTADVSYEDYLFNSIAGFTSTGEENVQLLPSISVDDLKTNYGFTSGDTVYFMVYPGAARLYGYWEDKEYKVEAGLNPSLAVTFTLTLS